MLRIFVPALAMCALGSTALAQSGPDYRLFEPVLAAKAQTPSFETQWAVIETFMMTHTLSDNAMVRLTIKAETLDGKASWLCSGNQIGWPATAADASAPAPVLYFFTSIDAAYCAQLILDLAAQQ